MEVVDYELFDVPPRYKFLKLETSDGTVGWGEPTFGRQSRTVETAVSELIEDFVLGKDPHDIEDLWQRMYRRHYRGGPVLMTAIAGIDQALWDIKGKSLGAPVYELLGGKARDRIRIYQWIIGDTPEELARVAREQVDDGFTALKMLGPNQSLRRIDSPAAVQAVSERVAAVRDAVGDEVDIGVDFHGRATKPMAKRLVSALEPFEPMFIEEPVLPQYVGALEDLSEATDIPIATGERMHSRWDFREAFERNAIDIAQPDLSHAGGITEVRKIGAMAETYDVALAPHMPYGPVAAAASLQTDACTPNAFIQEQLLHEVSRLDGATPEERLACIRNPELFDHDDGYVELPAGPGLGVDVDESRVREQQKAYDPNVFRVFWRNDDGSVAEK